MSRPYVVRYCERHGTPIGPHGCRICPNEPVPMPEWFKAQLVAMGLREPDPDQHPITDHTDTEGEHDR